MTEALKNIPPAIKELKESSNTLLGFALILILILIGGIVGIACLSKLKEIYNLIIIGILLSLLLYVLLKTFNNAIKNPQKFVFNQNAFITVMRENLSDSNNSKTYFSDQLPELNSQPMERIEAKEKEGSI